MNCCKLELPLLNGESFEITSAVPLNIKKHNCDIFLQFPIYCRIRLILFVDETSQVVQQEANDVRIYTKSFVQSYGKINACLEGDKIILILSF